MPDFFANLLTLVLGFVLLMGGVHQLASLMAARRWMVVPTGYYVVPSLILLAGIVALVNPGGVQRTAFIIIGVSSMVYAVSDLLNWFTFTRRRPKPVVESDDLKEAEQKAAIEIEDAQIVE